MGNTYCMLGRVLSYDKCPICGNGFTVLPDETGIMCLEHKTVPNKFYINANKFKAGRIYSDPQGNSFDSFKVALRQLEAMRRDYDNRTFNPDNWIHKKVSSYRFDNVASEWIRGYEIEVQAGTKTKKYLRGLKQFLRDYLLPEFGKLDIRDIKEPQIKRLYHNLLDKKKSHKTTKHVLSTLKTLLIANKNIIIIIPDFPKFTVIPAKEKKWIGVEAQLKGLSCIPNKFHLAFELLFDTGMRPGELRALKKKDLRDGYLTISRAFSENILRGTTKTGTVITHRVSLSLWTKLIAYSKDIDLDDFIFTYNDKPYHYNKLYNMWKTACKKAEIEYITLYQATRHSTVSQIRQEKELEALNEAAKKLGHTDIRTTKKHYSIGGLGEIKLL